VVVVPLPPLTWMVTLKISSVPEPATFTVVLSKVLVTVGGIVVCPETSVYEQRTEEPSKSGFHWREVIWLIESELGLTSSHRCRRKKDQKVDFHFVALYYFHAFSQSRFFETISAVVDLSSREPPSTQEAESLVNQSRSELHMQNGYSVARVSGTGPSHWDVCSC
jgi:hypothetical protein